MLISAVIHRNLPSFDKISRPLCAADIFKYCFKSDSNYVRGCDMGTSEHIKKVIMHRLDLDEKDTSLDSEINTMTTME